MPDPPPHLNLAAAAAAQSLPDPYNLGSITAYLTNPVREMFQT